MFYLVRHGEADYSNNGTKIFQNYGINFAPLTAKGREQLKNTAKDTRLANADLIVASPLTRAMQSAAILSKELQIDLLVDPDIFEWVADKNFIQVSEEIAGPRFEEYYSCGGVWPDDGVERHWESNELLKERLTRALKRYKDYKNVIVVCHGMLMGCVQGGYIDNGQIVEYQL